MVRLYWPGPGKGKASIRPGKERILEKKKPKKGTSNASTRWLSRQSADPFVRAREKYHYCSRAAFKLIEMDEKHRLLKKGMKIIDLGAAPGGWLQVASEKTMPHPETILVGVDLLPINPLDDVKIITGDIREDDVIKAIQTLTPHLYDAILSDISPARSGHAPTDAMAQAVLAQTALDFAQKMLKPGGFFLCKIIQGAEEPAFYRRVKAIFTQTKRLKPEASRADSRELYILGKNFTPPPANSPSANSHPQD